MRPIRPSAAFDELETVSRAVVKSRPPVAAQRRVEVLTQPVAG